jgi:hypothetical protein
VEILIFYFDSLLTQAVWLSCGGLNIGIILRGSEVSTENRLRINNNRYIKRLTPVGDLAMVAWIF